MNYHVFETDKKINDWAAWFGMFEPENKRDDWKWKLGSSVYFRVFPQPEIWGLLIIFKLLNVINILYSDPV